MVKAGYDYLRLRKNKPTSPDASISDYRANVHKAKKKRDSLRAIVRKNSLKKKNK